jgi:four helix bundle protein
VPYDIRERTLQFAVRVIRAVRRLPQDAATRVIAHQLIKSATSVGANVEEADGAESPRDFVYKTSIARKEARESRYWLRLVRAAIVDSEEFAALEQESDELVRIFSSMIANTRRRKASHGEFGSWFLGFGLLSTDGNQALTIL